MMTDKQIIATTVTYVQKTLAQAEGGHDWWHIHRVWNNARHIAQTEQCHLLTVELAALLHDIADSKFNNGDEEIGPQLAIKHLQSLGLDDSIVVHVGQIIRHMSFKASFDTPVFQSAELHIVQDADRLDAIGAIGIARAFNYGGFKGRALYDPGVPPNLNMSKEEYKNSTAPTINHFYEKLLLLKDRMNTVTGKRLAQQRHNFMQTYLDQFFKECDFNFRLI